MTHYYTTAEKAKALRIARNMAQDGKTWLDIEAQTKVSQKTFRRWGFTICSARSRTRTNARYYTPEFKCMALRMYDATDYGVKGTAQRLGIPRGTMGHWVYERRNGMKPKRPQLTFDSYCRSMDTEPEWFTRHETNGQGVNRKHFEPVLNGNGFRLRNLDKDERMYA